MSDTNSRIQKLKEVCDLVNPKFKELALILNKYPFAFKIKYSEKQGEYLLIVNEEFLNSDDPIALSKSTFSPKQL